MSESALSIRGLTKTFGGVPALDNLNLDLVGGEIHGLLGQNGSGKSTAIKILGGYHTPDAGTVSMSGHPLKLPLTQAHQQGIAIIHQDLGLVGSMTVLENIGIPDGYGVGRLRPINWTALRDEVEAIFDRLGAAIDPTAMIDDLNPSDHSIVAVARALRLLSLHAEQHVLILDEPTAYLGPEESRRLLAVMRAVASHGASVLFVSHKINEVLNVTDRCTVLRDGKRVATENTAGLAASDLVRLQLGRDLEDFYPPPATDPRDRVVLSVNELSSAAVSPTSFQVRAGELLGITGLAGMGHDELIELLGGAQRVVSGRVIGPDQVMVRSGVRSAKAAGIAMLPADRKGRGLWLDASGRENYTLPKVAQMRFWERVSTRRERALAAAAFQRVDVRPLAPDRPVRLLSGGNQQKVLLAKWLDFQPTVLLLHEPTQGVDAAAKREILQLINESVAAGMGVVMCSTDYEQLAATCHRVLVMSAGTVVEELPRPLSEARILLACHGQDSRKPAAEVAMAGELR